MSELRPYDKVTVKGWHGELTVFEFAKTMAIVTDHFGTYHACDIQDMRKVEEKKAPPKFTKVYVWDGDERPEHPRMAYSFGKLAECCNLGVFATTIYSDAPVYYKNWEVIE